MHKFVNRLKNIFKDFLKTDYKKTFLIMAVFCLNVFINITILFIACSIQFDYEWKQIQKERRRAYEEDLCNYDEPCEYPY